jgi:hypothetical protein
MKSTANLVDQSAGWPAHVMKLLADGFTTKIARAARSFVCFSTRLPSTCPPRTCGS